MVPSLSSSFVQAAEVPIRPDKVDRLARRGTLDELDDHSVDLVAETNLIELLSKLVVSIGSSDKVRSSSTNNQTADGADVDDLMILEVLLDLLGLGGNSGLDRHVMSLSLTGGNMEKRKKGIA